MCTEVAEQSSAEKAGLRCCLPAIEGGPPGPFQRELPSPYHSRADPSSGERAQGENQNSTAATRQVEGMDPYGVAISRTPQTSRSETQHRTPSSTTSSNNTYLMPTSPSKKAKGTGDNYKPKIVRTCGQRPACLVNASVTYCGNDQIYAFGGFDQYTDEGKPRSAIFYC